MDVNLSATPENEEPCPNGKEPLRYDAWDKVAAILVLLAKLMNKAKYSE